MIKPKQVAVGEFSISHTELELPPIDDFFDVEEAREPEIFWFS